MEARYSSSMMDCLDKMALNVYYLVMDNLHIHNPATVRNLSKGAVRNARS